MKHAQKRPPRLRWWRDLFQQARKVSMNSATHQFVHVESLTIEKGCKAGLLFPSSLNERADEECTASELLHDQVARLFIAVDFKPARQSID